MSSAETSYTFESDRTTATHDSRLYRPMVIPLGPGDILVFSSLFPHGIPANRSPYSRRALQFHYVSTSAITIGGKEHREIFGSEGKNVEC